MDGERWALRRRRAVGFLSAFVRSKKAVTGAFLLVVFVGSAVFAPVITGPDPLARPEPPENATTGEAKIVNGTIQKGNGSLNEFYANVSYQPPSAEYPLGTDQAGRSVYAQLVYGSRVSLFVGLVVGLISVTVGVGVGAVSGYYGGWIDDTLQRLTEMFLTFPRLPFLILVITLVGQSLGGLILALGVLSWEFTARITRGEYLRLRNEPFVDAARASGNSDAQILFKHILPSASPPILVNTTISVGAWIIAEANLSFLGFGAGMLSWGDLIFRARAQSVVFDAWWLTVFPGLSIVAVVLAFYLLAQGVSDIINPSV